MNPSPLRRLAVTSFLLVAAAGFGDSAKVAQTLAPLPEAPIIAAAPRSVSATWQAFDDSVLTVAPRGTFSIALQPPPRVAARLDIFKRVNSSWTWQSRMSLPLNQERLELPADVALGVLLRVPNDFHYAWGEIDTTKASVVHLRWFKSVEVSLKNGGDGEREVVLYASGPPRSLRTSRRSVRLDLIPSALDTIVCATDETSSASCVVVPAGSSSAEPERDPAMMERVVSSQAPVARVSAASPSASVARPIMYPATAFTAGGWVLLRIAQEAHDSLGFVVDVERTGCAKVRMEGIDLAPPPAAIPLTDCASAGVALRPAIRGVETDVEQGARLVVLTGASGVAARVAFATARVDPDGVVRLPDIGAGRYFLKLTSSMASNRIAEASLSKDSVPTVTFDAGPIVRGKIVLEAGGAVAGEPRIDVVRVADVPSMAEFSRREDELADWIRAVKAAPDGRFAFVVNLGGPYELRASWGSGVAVRKFVVETPPKDLDLGTITLTRGATLRGVIRDCAGGEFHISPLPDLTQPIRPVPPAFRRVTMDAEGRFYLDSLTAGEWLVSATCGGQRATLEPSRLSLRDGADSVVDFSVVELRAVSPPRTP